MTQEEMLLWVLVLVIAIQGVWLAGLTFLVFRRRARKREELESKEEEEGTTKST
jgi:cytochrome c-type biogenesis protein CcmH/NrfF